jgi:ferredoxin
MRYLAGVTTLRLDPARCTGCGRCVEVCPHAVLAIAGRTATIADRDGCMECGACARNCEPGALTVRAGVGCAWAITRGALGGASSAGCGPGSGPGCGCG